MKNTLKQKVDELIKNTVIILLVYGSIATLGWLAFHLHIEEYANEMNVSIIKAVSARTTPVSVELEEAPSPEEPSPQTKPDIKTYICQKFGKDCRLALAVVHAENGTLACDRISKPNWNKTVDRGLWQLNSRYHPFIDDCYKNTDRAYEIYKSRKNTFDRWSAYNNGSYKKFLNSEL